MNTIINEFIKQFIYEHKKKEKYKWNEINIILNISKNNINNEIYFLNKEFNNTELNKLNELNTELYINDIKDKYKKYFKPDKEGEYHIKLKYKINLIDCSYMFANCKNITQINFISFNTKYVTSMDYMFHKCKNLKYINNLLLFDTRNVRDMADMFSFCENLNNLDLSSFNIKNVTNMSYMFYYCYNLKSLKLFSLNTKNVIKMDYIFDMCIKLKSFPFNNKDNIYENKYPNEIDILIKIGKDDIGKEIYLLGNYDDDYIDLGNGERLYLSITELYFNNKQLGFHKFFIPKDEGEYNIKLKTNIMLKDCSYMFANCKNIIQINFTLFNTSHIRNMIGMFSNCINLSNLDLSIFDTKNVIDMSNMFYNCCNLKNLNLSSFDTKKVTNMSNMFYNCYNLKNLNLSSFDTKNVIDMSYIFYKCPENIYESYKSKFKKYKIEK